jgi:hypothetical protein
VPHAVVANKSGGTENRPTPWPESADTNKKRETVTSSAVKENQWRALLGSRMKRSRPSGLGEGNKAGRKILTKNQTDTPTRERETRRSIGTRGEKSQAALQNNSIQHITDRI